MDSILADNYKRLHNKPCLFDIILLTVNTKTFFGAIVYVKQEKVKSKSDEDAIRIDPHEHKQMEYELCSTICVYTSRECSNAIKAQQKEMKNDQIRMTKISNMTSSRRMLSAIHNIADFPLHSNLLQPTRNSPYFDLPDEYDEKAIEPFDNFNLPQSKVISIAQCMFDDMQEHMHLVHGPPGRYCYNTNIYSENLIKYFRHWKKSNYCWYRHAIVGQTWTKEKNSSLCSVQQCL